MNEATANTIQYDHLTEADFLLWQHWKNLRLDTASDVLVSLTYLSRKIDNDNEASIVGLTLALIITMKLLIS